EPVQKVHDQVDFVMANERIREEGTVEEMVKKFIRPFDLSQAPLIRVSLLEIHDHQNLLLIDMHHIVSDGISHGILANDFQALYEEKALSPLRIQYKDFSEWQNSETERKKLRQQEAYWLNEFAGDIPLLNLPTDYNRPDRLGFKGHAVEFTIDKTLTGTIKTQALQMNVTVMMFLLSIYNILLSKYALKEDIIVGTVTAGRQHAELDYIIGFFVNMLLIRTLPAQGKRFCDYLAEVREKAVKAYENQDYPFEELVNKLEIPQQSGRHPLANVVFVYRDETQPARKSTMPELRGVDLDPRNVSHFDLMLHATNFHDSISISFEYSTVMFKTKTIERLSTLYQDILEQVLEDVQIRLEEITTGHEFVTVKSNVLQDSQHDFDF
ncbi:MAG: non-ribosomal peptide synthetase, partial [Candidatus Aminicenantes bacterium]